MQKQAELLVLGQITSTFGVKGWVKVFSYTQPKENIFSYTPWLIKQNNQQVALKLMQGKTQGKGLIAKLEGVNSPEDAAEYLGKDLYLDPANLPVLEEDDFYLNQVLGFKVINLQDELLGEVAGFIETGANDVVIVKPCIASLDKQERLIPLVLPQIVKQANFEAGTLIVDWHADY